MKRVKKNKRNVLQIRFPFDPALSDNRRLCWSPRSARMFCNRGYMSAKKALAILIGSRAKNEKFSVDPKLPVSVKLLVCKPNARYDASNFIKPVNDAVSEALTNGEDNLFYGSYDWIIDRAMPRIEITIGQSK